MTHVYSCDFETTVYDGQTNTEVWASAIVELFTEDVLIHHSIEETFNYFEKLKHNSLLYYHNLKFDGTFWLSYLLNRTDYKQAFERTSMDSELSFEIMSKEDMPRKSFNYSISDRGQWYVIRIRTDHNYIEIRDSLKLLPFSVRKIGKSFGTKHKKLDMKYKGYRYAGCDITEEEQHYIANDVLVVKEALEIMYEQGHKKLTIGSCCLEEYKKTIGDEDEYRTLFPPLEDIELSPEHTYKTAEQYIRKSYKGGWCYLASGKENKVFHNGTTADVNSLYPSMMSSESGNVYPVGRPTFWTGNIPSFLIDENNKGRYYYFIRIRTRFYLKKNKLPFIQIKGSWLYRSTENLATSDIRSPFTGKYSRYYIGTDGERHDSQVEMIMTMTDYALFLEHYDVCDFEIVDGCYFNAEIGLFDRYIEKYKKIKMESKGAIRELAKLFLNNLYGKMASNDNSSFKMALLNDNTHVLDFIDIKEHKKKPGYIAVGTAITSYARNFTIRAAQKNYHGKDKPGFIYADTDSIHCDLPPEQIVGITTHDTNFCCWKLESCWDEGLFVRQKTYVEHITHENLLPTDPYYNVKCAGMPERSKDLFIKSITGYQPTPEDYEEYNEQELNTILTRRDLTDFKIGLKIYGKLLPKRINGGTVLVDTSYQMR